MSENNPTRANFERIVVEPISNGFLVHITTDDDEKVYSYKSFRQLSTALKKLLKTLEESSDVE